MSKIPIMIQNYLSLITIWWTHGSQVKWK